MVSSTCDLRNHDPLHTQQEGKPGRRASALAMTKAKAGKGAGVDASGKPVGKKAAEGATGELDRRAVDTTPASSNAPSLAPHFHLERTQAPPFQPRRRMVVTRY